MGKNKLLDVLTFSTISRRILPRLFWIFLRVQRWVLSVSVAKTHRIYKLIRLRARVSLEAHGSTAINLYTSADCSDSWKLQPPHATCIMNRCARSCSHWSSDAWRMAEFHWRPKVKSYPLPDPGIRPRCMISVPMCWDWKVTAGPLTHLRLPHGAAIPASAPHEPWTFGSQIPTSPIIQSQRSCLLSSSHLHPRFPSTYQPTNQPTNPQTPTKAIHL